MSYRTNVLGMLVQFEPEKAIAKISAAYAEAGTETEAAAMLDCGKTSLQRWVARLIKDGHLEKPFKCGKPKPREGAGPGLMRYWEKKREQKAQQEPAK